MRARALRPVYLHPMHPLVNNGLRSGEQFREIARPSRVKCGLRKAAAEKEKKNEPSGDFDGYESRTLPKS